MKSVWAGSLAFGLVNIPVKLYSATEQQSLGFKMLCEKCHSPIQYKRWCPHCKKEVEWSGIVKGFEIKKGEYFVLTKEKIEELKPEKTDSIEILEFVDKKVVDPIYFHSHYYVGPKSEKEKAYFLFKEVLGSTAMFAIGKFVMRDKQYICAIESYKDGLLLTTLNYAYEIRDINKVLALQKAPKLDKKELDLSKKLIKKMYKKDFDITQFKDTFAQELKKLIKDMIKGKKKLEKIEVKKVKRPPKQDLMESLRASLR